MIWIEYKNKEVVLTEVLKMGLAYSDYSKIDLAFSVRTEHKKIQMHDRIALENILQLPGAY